MMSEDRMLRKAFGLRRRVNRGVEETE